MKRARMSRRGMTLLEIMVVVGLIGMLALLAMPYWKSAREKAETSTCQSNLRLINSALSQIGMEFGPNTEVTWDHIVPTYMKKKESCPAGGVYEFKSPMDVPICTIGGTHVIEGER